MTEHEWLASNDPAAMLRWTHDLLQPSGTHGCSDRKLRLFACACCRNVWHLLTDERSRQAVEVAERYADEGATGEALRVACDGADDAYSDGLDGPETASLFDAWASANPDAREAAKMITAAPNPVPYTLQVALFRDIVGNPFAPAARVVPTCDCTGNFSGSLVLTPATLRARCLCGRSPVVPWLTPTVLSIARAAYEDRNPDGALDAVRLSILGDALEEAGCDEAGILQHLRLPGRHYRGCWAVDCVLGKE